MQRGTYFCYFFNGVLYFPPQEGPTRHKETQGQLSQFLARDWKSLQDKRYYCIQAMPANSPSLTIHLGQLSSPTNTSIEALLWVVSVNIHV
jgi:hypothetical protein